MHKTTKKLTLSRETLSILTLDRALRPVVGGVSVQTCPEETCTELNHFCVGT